MVSPGRTGGISAPRLPIVVAPTPPVISGTVAAVLSSVDNPANPQIATFIVNGTLPAYSGFTWNSSLAATVAMAPNPATAPPVGTVYYNNTTTQDGGTIFLVDVTARSIISATSNFSTIPPVNYSTLFQDITHNGAFNTTGNFQNPNPLDVTSLLGNPSPTTAPVLVPPLPPSYGITYVGANGIISSGGSYDAQIQFNTLLTNPPWLQELRLYVAATGTKVDNVANIDHTFAYKTTLSPSSTGQYTAWFHGLVAGVPYDMYVAYVDLKGVVSYGRYLETTAANPIQVNASNMASMGNPGLVTPKVLSHGTDFTEDGAAGSTAFDYLVPNVALDANGYSSNLWLAEIELVYINQQKPNNIMYANTLAVQASGTYQFVYPQLPVGVNSDGSQIVYQLGVRYVDYVAQRSNVLLFDQVGSSTLLVGSPTLQTIPNGTTFSVDFSGCTEGPPTNNGGGTFAQLLQFNLTINSSVPYVQWLDKIQLLAKEQPSGVPDSDQNPGNYVKVGQITGSIYTNPISQSFGNLGNDSCWQLAIQLVDHSGIFTNALPIFICGFQQSASYISPGSPNINFISDSDMSFTYSPAGATASNYWTYANLDPTRFRVVKNANSINGLIADSHNGSNVGPVCAYSDIIQVISGQTYTLSCITDLYFAGAGLQVIGICDNSDKIANNPTPTAIYASISCPANDPPPGGSLTQLSWTATLTGPISVFLYANNIHGDCGWFHPQFELGSPATAYKPGTAITEATATIAHGASSIAVQSTINNVGELNVSNPQSSSQLPLPNSAPEINDVITTGTGNRGTVNVSPTGGTFGSLPYTNNNPGTNLGVGTGGSVKASAFAAGNIISGTMTVVNVPTLVGTFAGVALPTGGHWTMIVTCQSLGGGGTGYSEQSAIGIVFGTSVSTLAQNTAFASAGNTYQLSNIGVFTAAGGQTITFGLYGTATGTVPDNIDQMIYSIFAVRTSDT